MVDVVIRQKDVDRLARSLLKEIFEFLHDDDYSLENYNELNKIGKDFFK